MNNQHAITIKDENSGQYVTLITTLTVKDIMSLLVILTKIGKGEYIVSDETE